MEWEGENKKGTLYYVDKDNYLPPSSAKRGFPFFKERVLRGLFSKKAWDKKWVLEARGLLKVSQKGPYTLSFSGEGLGVIIDGERVLSSADIIGNSTFHKKEITLDTGYHSINISVTISKNGIFPAGLFWEKPDGGR
jgi:hypothetical protein